MATLERERAKERERERERVRERERERERERRKKIVRVYRYPTSPWSPEEKQRECVCVRESEIGKDR